jgi:serine/threonine protein kinase
MQVWIGGDLTAMIKKKARSKSTFTEKETSMLIRKILKALEYCHSKGIIHKDLKPSDILFNKHNEPILIGLWNVQLSQSDSDSDLINNHYEAPELNDGNDPDSKSDIWSLGIILSVMLLGRYPLSGNNYIISEKLSEKMSDEAFDLLSKMLRVDPDQRYNATEWIDHPWLNKDTLNFHESDDDGFWDIGKPHSCSNRLLIDPLKNSRAGSERVDKSVTRLGTMHSEASVLLETNESSSQVKTAIGHENMEGEEMMQDIIEEIFDEETLKKLFSEYELDNEGFITSDEALEILEGLGIRMTKSEIEDSNGLQSSQSQIISFADFKHLIWEHQSKPLESNILSDKSSIL